MPPLQKKVRVAEAEMHTLRARMVAEGRPAPEGMSEPEMQVTVLGQGTGQGFKG